MITASSSQLGRLVGQGCHEGAEWYLGVTGDQAVG